MINKIKARSDVQMFVFQRLVIWFDGCVETQGLNNALARIKKLRLCFGEEKHSIVRQGTFSADALFARMPPLRGFDTSRSEIDCAHVAKRDGR